MAGEVDAGSKSTTTILLLLTGSRSLMSQHFTEDGVGGLIFAFHFWKTSE